MPMQYSKPRWLTYGVFTPSSKRPANVQQTSSKRIQNTRANAGRLLDRVNTLLRKSILELTSATSGFSTVWYNEKSTAFFGQSAYSWVRIFPFNKSVKKT